MICLGNWDERSKADRFTDAVCRGATIVAGTDTASRLKKALLEEDMEVDVKASPWVTEGVLYAIFL